MTRRALAAIVVIAMAGPADADELPADEVKVVIDDTVDEAVLDRYAARWRCEHYFLQPWMDARYEHNLARAIAMIQARPQWRLSLQIHKIIRVP